MGYNLRYKSFMVKLMLVVVLTLSLSILLETIKTKNTTIIKVVKTITITNTDSISTPKSSGDCQ